MTALDGETIGPLVTIDRIQKWKHVKPQVVEGSSLSGKHILIIFIFENLYINVIMTAQGALLSLFKKLSMFKSALIKTS